MNRCSRFSSSLDYGKKRGNTKEEKERERLKHKYKREFKGALREIRKDTRFLAQEKLGDVMRRSVFVKLRHVIMSVVASVSDCAVVFVRQGRGEEEEGEGAVRQSGHAGGRMEGPQEEEEEVMKKLFFLF